MLASDFMPAIVAQLLTWIFVIYIYSRDKHRPEGVSLALIFPLLWYLVCASRPVGVWFIIWGVPMPGGGGAMEGSPIDRMFWSGLTVIGWVILARRRISWGAFASRNALPLMWSDYSSVSFKRYIKIIGSVTMALVVLTERDPFAAFTTLIRRAAIFHLPFSLLFIRYYRELGISWSWDGSSVSWQGIATSKNTLGQVAMVAAIYFLWEVIRHWKERGWKNLNFGYLLLAIYLLKGSDDALSLTSISVFVFAVIVFWRLNHYQKQNKPVAPFVATIMVATFSLLTLVIVHSVVMFEEDSPFGWIIVNMGRDITLTDRTVIWGQVYDVAAASPLLGLGVGGFWIGRLANIPFTEPLTWTLGQAHSGYVDTYLQLGWAGLFLFFLIVMNTCRNLLGTIKINFEAGRLFLTLFLTILYVNITETTFLRGDHHLWFIFQVVIWQTLIRPSDDSDQPAINPVETPNIPKHETLGYS